jgi:hypothetical protein
MTSKRVRLWAAGVALVLVLAVQGAGAGSELPRSIVVDAPVQHVVCKAGCCCGSVSVRYQGHWYDTGWKGYCRWFRGLREGQIVRARLMLVR